MIIETVGGAQLYQGDALHVLASLADASVDCALTDPPYSSGGMVRGDRLQADIHSKYGLRGEAINLMSTFTGDTRDQVGYLFWCALWLNELRRVLKPGAVCGLFTDWRQLPVTTCALQSGGFVWRGVVPWHKPAARPMLGRYTAACEYLVWGTNGPREIEGPALPGFYSVSPPPSAQREHVTEKPVELLSNLLAVAPEGGLVIDPFMGSGSCGVACVHTGRRFIGVELDGPLFARCIERIAAAQSQGRLFA